VSSVAPTAGLKDLGSIHLAPTPVPGVRLAEGELPDRSRLSIDACGDSSVIGVFGADDGMKEWANAQGLAAELRKIDSDVVRTIVASYDSVFVEFDADAVSAEQFARTMLQIGELAPFPVPLPRRRLILPIVYGGEFGPDLEELADDRGMTPREVIAAHHARPYVVRCVASPPGSPMLDAPALLQGVPRLTVPRARVPAGSVAVAGQQCTVYATTSPGGWRIIGRTPATLLDLDNSYPLVMAAGDLVEFHPIHADDWDASIGRLPEVRGV
jgi:KipI family sensor histidine kinase inhibitor